MTRKSHSESHSSPPVVLQTMRVPARGYSGCSPTVMCPSRARGGPLRQHRISARFPSQATSLRGRSIKVGQVHARSVKAWRLILAASGGCGIRHIVAQGSGWSPRPGFCLVPRGDDVARGRYNREGRPGSLVPVLRALPLDCDAGGIAHLDPGRARAGSIRRVDTLRHDALGAELASVFEYQGPFGRQVFVE
jgi:hypothetical protein